MINNEIALIMRLIMRLHDAHG